MVGARRFLSKNTQFYGKFAYEKQMEKDKNYVINCNFLRQTLDMRANI